MTRFKYFLFDQILKIFVDKNSHTGNAKDQIIRLGCTLYFL